MFTIICWIFFCYLVGKFAEKRGRDFWRYVTLSAVLSPLVGFIIALVVGKKEDIQTNSDDIDDQPQPQDVIEERKEFCSGCGREIPAGSNNCPYCGQKQ